MPYGSISLSAKSLITSEDELKVDTELKINDFPYNYVNNPIEEIVPFMDPTTKIWVLDSLAKFNLELNLSSLLEFQPFKVKNVNIINGKMDFIIVDKPKVEMDSISLHANNISFITNKKSNKIVGLKSLEGEMEIGKVKFFPINETEIKLSFSGMDNNIKIDFGLENNELTTQEGSVNLNLNNKEKSYAIQFIVKDIDIENLVNSKKKERISKGYIDLFVNLQTSGLKSVNLMNNLNGKVKFLSKEMILYGMDIDELLKAYEKTQKFNLVDVSAFLFAGPIGTVATKGSDLLKLSMVDLKENDSTSISNLIVDLKISNGQLTTEDVALATLKNRIAFMGSIDLVNDTIPNFTVVVLDKKGCSKIEQKFYGKTDDIQIAKVKTLQVVFGSVKNVVKSVFGKKCEPIYTGTIKHPSKKDKINKE
jgi:AsmA protein